MTDLASPPLSATILSADVATAMRSVGLRYIDDTGPGISRRLVRGEFRYFYADGKPVKDKEEIARIRKLAIPPAYADVWICPQANGHLQATGRDARGRKQYRYHPHWRLLRDATKYHRMLAFGHALPKIRRRVRLDLLRPALCREKVLATVVSLLEATLIRIGNEEYARSNQSFGLTTLRNRHVKISGKQLLFKFRGKSGQQHEIALSDERLARIVKRCRELPGQELFQYVDDEGARHVVNSADVNLYLKEITGEDFTAKDFRTWSGTVLAATALADIEAFDSETEAKRNVVQAIESVACLLGNTPTICRRCYVHPEIIDAYFDRTLTASLRRGSALLRDRALRGLHKQEVAVIALLRARQRGKKAA
jgi:DNA topoisomerase I